MDTPNACAMHNLNTTCAAFRDCQRGIALAHSLEQGIAHCLRHLIVFLLETVAAGLAATPCIEIVYFNGGDTAQEFQPRQAVPACA